MEEPVFDDGLVPFRNWQDAIRYLNTRNPARMRCKNILEDHRDNPPVDPVWLWHQVLYSIEAALKHLPPDTQRQWYRGYRLRDAWQDIAKDHHVHERTLRRRMARINEVLDEQLKGRGLVP